jgi:hypothetical protein
MTEHNADFIATSTSNVHKIGVRSRNEPFKLMLVPFFFNCWAQEVSVHALLKYLYNILFPLHSDALFLSSFSQYFLKGRALLLVV